ncbi:hypothetical protein CGH27_13595 [Vibrio parahaemolyticus]|uniref:DUF1538 domain-containing protein n=1 Tax=Vibrio parahaemolyticus TaxID=670 RepID=UPI0011241672|nr:DUF1538 domain-containing protein [Vibrio parahaemolyticus]TOP04861.1 hypothetical protein CGH27_13595 [Vibrio parahaemolyticus]TOP12256.1 hypothetical protein CGH26_14835 [Vibrio parahaemolyticus]
MEALTALFRALFNSARDLLPIVIVITFFQLVVLQEPLPNLVSILFGLLLVILGLTFFIFGLELGLFPIGENMAQAFARKGSVFWLLIFAFCLGFGTTIAEPALTAVAEEASEVAAEGGMIPNSEQSMTEYGVGLRITVAFSVGVAIVIGVLRILKGWPIHYMIIGVAYDSGGVTTSTITVPLVTALGVGLASAIKGRNPMVDGFGLIAFASLLPMMFVMIYGMAVT